MRFFLNIRLGCEIQKYLEWEKVMFDFWQMVVSHFMNKKLHIFYVFIFWSTNERPNWIDVDSEQYTPFLLRKKQLFDTIAW